MVKKKEKNTGKRILKGCLTVILFFIIIGIVGAIVMWQGYKGAELRDAEKKFVQMEKEFKEKYPQYESKFTKDLIIKIYLLRECDGGKDRINLLWDIDQNVTASAWSTLLTKNINLENLQANIENDLDLLNKIENIDFGDAMDEYKEHLNK